MRSFTPFFRTRQELTIPSARLNQGLDLNKHPCCFVLPDDWKNAEADPRPVWQEGLRRMDQSFGSEILTFQFD